MAQKYCDHGLYGACAFTASISGSTLTVTAVSSGQIGVGTEITGSGVAAGTYVTALGSGSGLTGTYSLGNTQTVSSRAMTGAFGAPLNTPLWGVAQEGDGAAQGAAVPAVVTIDLSSATAAAGATVSIMGATLTCVASGAGGNQFNAGSGATLVANLVAAINRTSNSVVVAAQAAGWHTPRVQDAVFARVGTPTTSLQIMTRAGSAQYNSSQVVTSGLTGGTFGPYTFSGGSSGAWGCMVNAPSYFPALAYGSGAYGLLGTTFAIAGSLQGGDNVRVRANKTIYCRQGITNNTQPLLPSVGSAANKVVYEIDDSTTWADGANPVLAFEATYYYAGTAFALGGNASAHLHIKGKEYASGQKNFVWRRSASGGGSDICALVCGGPTIFENLTFETTYSGAGNPGTMVVGTSDTTSSSASFTRVVNCNFIRQDNGSEVFMRGATGANAMRADFQGCKFILNAASGPFAAVYGLTGYGSTRNHVNLDGCEFIGFPTGSRLHVANASMQNFQSTLYARNCKLGGITLLGPNFAASAAPDLMPHAGRGLFVVSALGGRDMVMDTTQGFVGWESSRSYPTLNAKLYDGVTPWSIRMVPTATAGQVTPTGYLESPRFGKINTLGTGVRTATLELLIDTTLAWTRKDVCLVMEYVDANGSPRVVESYDYFGGALAASTAAWSATTFSEGGTLNFNKYKITLVTPTAVLAGSELSFFVRVNTTVSNTTQSIFFDPEVVVS